MSALFPPPQTRTIGYAKVDGKRVAVEVESAWFQYFAQGLYERAGGALGASTSELEEAQFDDAGIEELKFAVHQMRQELMESAAEVHQLREQLTVAFRQIQDLNEGPMV